MTHADPSEPVPLSILGSAVDLVPVGGQADEIGAALRANWSLCLRDPAIPAAETVRLAVDPTPEDSENSKDSVEDVETLAAPTLPALLVNATIRMTVHGIQHNAGTSLMFHAAGLTHPETGRTLLAIAPGGTGKTTLCHTLGPKLSYLTDECVAIRPDRTLIPYPKPLSLREAGKNVKREVDPTSCGLSLPEVEPVPVAVLFLRRRDDTQDVELTPLDPFDAIVRAAPESSSLSKLPRGLHVISDFFESLDTVAEVSYTEAAALGHLVDELLGGPR